LDRPDGRGEIGQLELVARTEEEAAEARALVLDAWSRGPVAAAFVPFAGGRAYFKQSALSGKTRWRYALKRNLLRRPLPRLVEHQNLTWLRARGFRAPEPLAAGAAWHWGLPRLQFLLTREIPRARALDAFLAEEQVAEERLRVLDELAREVARMHDLRFLHHDLFPRNVLVANEASSASSGRVWFLDCWAGGPPPQARGPAYDLACLTLRAGDSFTPAELERCFAVYEEARRESGRVLDSARFRSAVARERAALERRVRSRPRDRGRDPSP
jgi:tRNA A-37 threonylcarbamoyl transferase component Bud32